MANVDMQKEEELNLINKGIDELKKELVPKIDSIYKQCLEHGEPNIAFKSSFEELTSKHIEYLALEVISRLFKNPSSVEMNIQRILEANDELQEYTTGFYILLNFGLLCLYEEEYF